MADKFMTVTGAGGQTGVDWANAYANSDFQTALDALAAGDTFFVEEGTYTQGTILDIDVNPGASDNYIKFIGVNFAHVADGTQPVIDGDSAISRVFVLRESYWNMENFRVINSTAHGFLAGTVASRWIVKNVDCSSNGDDGINMAAFMDRTLITQSQFNNNGGNGIETADAILVTHSECIGNNIGFDTSPSNSTIESSILHDNTSHGCLAASDTKFMYNIIDDNGGDGIALESGAVLCTILFNRITNNAGAGISTNGAGAFGYEDYNGFYNNTGGNIDVSGGGSIESPGNSVSLTSDGYTNQASDDFSLQTDGEAVGMAVFVGCIVSGNNSKYNTAGLAPEYSGGGGGGGLITHPGMNGGING